MFNELLQLTKNLAEKDFEERFRSKLVIDSTTRVIPINLALETSSKSFPHIRFHEMAEIRCQSLL